MANYKYTAITPKGEEDGTVVADSVQGAIIKLKEQNYKVVSIKETSAFGGSDLLNKEITIFQRKLTTKDLAIFCRQLHTMLSSGMPITRCMDVLAEQSEHPQLKEAVKAVSQDIRKGNIFSEALRVHPKVFPALLVNMIEAGELTGNLDNVVLSMALHYDNESSINSKINLALAYPKFLGLAAVLVLVGMLVFIVPSFMEMFIDSGSELPGPTMLLIGMSDFVTNNPIILLFIVITLYLGSTKLLEQDKFKFQYQLFVMGLPKIGDTTKKLVATRFSRTMATLLASGIPIVNALEASAKVTDNLVLITKMETVVEEIRKGNSLSYFLKEMDIFPPILISMVSIGEESGDLDGMFSKVADYFDSELDENIKKLISIIEPAMIVVMGLIMGFIIIAMYMPILQMGETINQTTP